MNEIKTYTEGGIGRKHCPGCNLYVGPRVKVCPCGYEFKASVPKPPANKTRQAGMKECVDCKNLIPIRSKICQVCHHNFSLDSEEIPVDTRPPAVIESENTKWQKHLGWSGRVVLAPAGDCPARLYEYDQQSVEDWCNLVIMRGLGDSRLYSPNALRCFARHFVEPSSDTFERISESIEAWFQKMMDL